MKDIIKLYKKGSITKFAAERELSDKLGKLYRVNILEIANQHSSNSFGIFPIIVKESGKFIINLLIDKNAFINYYQPDELEEILLKLKTKEQKLLALYKSHIEGKELTFNEIFAAYLRGYIEILPILKVSSEISFLPELGELLELSKEETEMDDALEKLLVSGYIAEEIIDIAKKNSLQSIKVVSDEKERPTMFANYLGAHVYAEEPLGDVRHSEIDYNYTPSTNQ